MKPSLNSGYRCPNPECNHRLPVDNIVGEVIVYCRYCKRRYHLSSSVRVKAVRDDEQLNKTLFKANQ